MSLTWNLLNFLCMFLMTVHMSSLVMGLMLAWFLSSVSTCRVKSVAATSKFSLSSV